MVAAACVAVHAGGIKFDITSDHEDATYKLGEQAVFTVKALDASGAPAKSGRVKWTLNNFGDKVFVVVCEHDDHNIISVNAYKYGLFSWGFEEIDLAAEEYTVVPIEKRA